MELFLSLPVPCVQRHLRRDLPTMSDWRRKPPFPAAQAGLARKLRWSARFCLHSFATNTSFRRRRVGGRWAIVAIGSPALRHACQRISEPRAMGTSVCQSSAVGKSRVPADTAHGSPKERNPSAEWLAVRHLWHELGDGSGGTVGRSRLSWRLHHSGNGRMCCALHRIQTAARFSPCTELNGGQQSTWVGNREEST